MSFFTKETKSFYIARPAEAANHFIYLHPDKSVARGSKITVRSDECALFFREGKYIATIPPGTTTILDTANLPFLGHLLVDKFTGADHFIIEIFFVRLAETIASVGPVILGQYQDLNSKNIVSVELQLQYTIKVQEPVKLISEIGGQSTFSQENILQVFNGRLLNGMRKLIGQRASQLPIFSIVSNVDVEALSVDLKGFIAEEFSRAGAKVERVFDLKLQLDEDSLNILREFGKQEANLAIQAKGSQLAKQDGFAEFNLIQGQRAALEGLGQGLSNGQGVAIMGMGLGIGGNLSVARSGGNVTRSSRWERESTTGKVSSLAPPRTFYIKAEHTEEGPYPDRTVALIAISKNMALSDILIRGDDDPVGLYFPASAEPTISNEYKRRNPQS